MPSPERIAQVLFQKELTHAPALIERDELRYLIGYPNEQDPVLVSWAEINNDYRTKTIYLDTPDGTWSRGLSQTKIRLRNYNSEMTWWIEVKYNVHGKVAKHRRILYPEDLRTLTSLVPVVMVTYHRSEFESPHSAPGLRVTVDNDLLVWRLPEGTIAEVMYVTGTPIAKLTRRVLETKGPSNFPAWLPLPKQWDGSKSRYALAALANHPETIAPSVTNALAA